MLPRSILRSVSGFIPSISRLTTNLIYDRWHVDYEDLKGKPFFPGLIKYMAAGPVVGMVWEGLDAVKTGRAMLGATNPLASQPGTFSPSAGVAGND